jgi:pimeloyl-ACP methyl ester carboxylesterase
VSERQLTNAQLVLIPGAGHLPQVENPHEFLAALVDFISDGPDTRHA